MKDGNSDIRHSTAMVLPEMSGSEESLEEMQGSRKEEEGISWHQV